MVYGDLKDLPRRTSADKVLDDQVFNITKNPRYGWYQRGLASILYIFLIKRLLIQIKEQERFWKQRISKRTTQTSY